MRRSRRNGWHRIGSGALIALLGCTVVVPASGQGVARKFSFGSRAAAGATLVNDSDAYTRERGYGFLGGSPKREGESVCSDKPFFFLVDAAEGNYDVTLRLGSDRSDADTTVKIEARRLLLTSVETRRGKFAARTFTVNVRYAELKAGGTVRLKPDEQDDFDWDHRLELEFNGKHPCVQSIGIVPNEHAPTVCIAGDSTVTDQRREPYAAWGQMLPYFFEAGVAIANHAESGESLKSFIGEHREEKLLETLKAGDYLFIQFTHNDQKPGAAHVDAFTSYEEVLKRYMDEARSRGATPVLVTSMHRRRFDESGKIVNTLEDYPEAMRQLAAREKVALIDLNAMSKTLFETLGPEGTLHVFVHYPAGAFPGVEQALADDTHFNNYGAYELARCVVQGIRDNHLGIAKYLRKDEAAFDPAHPDALESWKLPVSPLVEAPRAEGKR